MQKTKSQTVAFFLNFFLPGLGFAYLGRPALIFGGVVFFVASTIDATHHLEEAFDPIRLILSLVAALAIAVIGSDAAEMFNHVRPASRKCPHCAEEVKIEAKVCKHCGRELAALES